VVNGGLRKEWHGLKFGHGNPTSEQRERERESRKHERGKAVKVREKERESYESELALPFLFPSEDQGIARHGEGHSNVKIVGQNIETDA